MNVHEGVLHTFIGKVTHIDGSHVDWIGGPFALGRLIHFKEDATQEYHYAVEFRMDSVPSQFLRLAPTAGHLDHIRTQVQIATALPVYHFASRTVSGFWVYVMWALHIRDSLVEQNGLALCMRPDTTLSGQEIVDTAVALAKYPKLWNEPVTTTEVYYV